MWRSGCKSSAYVLLCFGEFQAIVSSANAASFDRQWRVSIYEQLSNIVERTNCDVQI